MGVNNGDTPSAIGSTVPPQGAGASGGNLVTSVFGRIGAVIAALSDYDASQVDNDSTVAGATVENALDTLLGLIVPAPVDSVFGRIGAVVAALSDYDASQVDNDSTVAGATVENALDTLLGLIVPAPVTSVFGRVGVVVAALSDYDASQVDNDSTVTGATVENALDTLLGLIGDPATKEAFFSPQQDDNIGDYRTRTIGGAGAFEFSFVVPHDFTSIISLEMILTPASNVTAENIDLTSDYGPDAGSIIAFSETDITNVVTFTAGDWNVMDISSVFSSLAAGHRCGIELDHQGIGSTVHYLFLRLRYS